MKLLLLQKFNNYFNRTIKLYSTTAEYKTLASSFKSYDGVNFNPNDGIRTKHVLGKGTDENFNINECDYLICYDVDDNNAETIVSRWFIIEAVRTRANQYELTLKRDTIADNFNTLLTCPAYIKKGFVSDDSPYIVNDEGVRVNQKLENQIPLKDDSGSAWLVGYMAKNFGVDDSISVQIDDLDNEYVSIEDIATELGVATSDLSAALTTNKNNPTYIVNDNIELVSWINYVDNTSLEYKILAGSQDGLESFTYGTPAPIINSHNPTSDCYAKEVIIPYSSNLNTTKVINLWKAQCNNNKNAIKNVWPTVVGHPLFTRKVYTKLKQLADNNILIYKAGTYYNVRVGAVSGPTNTGQLYSASALSSPFSSMCSNVISGYNTGLDPSTTTHLQALTGGKIFINYNELVVNFYLEEATSASGLTTIDYTMSSTRNACKDQVFDIFAIPYNNLQVKNGGTTLEGIGDRAQELSVKLAQKLVVDNTTYQIYDLQLLPYCPIPEICSNGKIDITNLTSARDYDFITQTGQYETTGESSGSMTGNEFAPGMYEGEYYVNTGVPVGDIVDFGYEIEDSPYQVSPVVSQGTIDGKRTITVSCLINDFDDAQHIDVRVWWSYNTTGTINKTVVLYPKRSSFTVDIHQSLTLKDEMKVESNCNNYRLVSPNYQGSFDFNVAKNGGSVNQFFAKCTYKPYTPYIRVVPEFSWLYSTNYPQECRGLICGGDFSIGIINDRWEEYQLQNKNYQNIFNREIQSLDRSQSIARQQQGWQVAGGTVQSAVSGAATGVMMTGSPYGALIGLGTGAASLAGGLMDTSNMEAQMIEQRQLSIDKFGLQLGNIQALPYTLTKVGAFDTDSMIWPFLEYYTCTDEEKEAFRMKIRYEGMTLGIVDTLENYLYNTGTYLQADLIRNESIQEDAHTVEDIYVELTKGVYL